MAQLKLPVDDFIDQIQKHFQIAQNLVLTAEPGAGKTTRLPPALAKTLKPGEKILVLEPRRIAVVSATHRIADEESWTVGSEIGYQVRFEKKLSESTPLVFLTEKLILKKILNDPELKNIAYVIFDEFHERTSSSDFALGFLREMQLMGHPIKLLVMSATLDAQTLSDYLAAPILKIPGQLFENKVVYDKKAQSLHFDDQFLAKLKEAVSETLKLSQKDILVFLPGTREINRAKEYLNTQFKNFTIEPLHGSLSLAEQKEVLKVKPLRRMILATNLAESALTLENVDAVIDSGLEKSAEYDLETGFTSISLKRISIPSAIQRQGRAARQFPGVTYKLWTQFDERSMSKAPKSALAQEDLSQDFLSLAQLGITNWQDFSWFEKPKAVTVDRYAQKLKALGLVNTQNRITPLGQKVLELPLDIHHSLFLISAQKDSILELACMATAIAQENSFFEDKNASMPNPHATCDLIHSLEIFEGFKNDHPVKTQIQRIAFQIFNSLSEKQTSSAQMWAQFKSQLNNPDQLNKLRKNILTSYADQLCRSRGEAKDKNKKGLRRDGMGVEVSKTSLAQHSDFFIILNALKVKTSTDLFVTAASGFTKKEIEAVFEKNIETKEELIFDEEMKKFYVTKNNFIDSIAIDISHRSLPNKEQLTQLLSNYIFKNLVLFLAQCESLNNLFQRIRCAEFYLNKEMLTEPIIQNILKDASYGQASLEDLKNLDWTYFVLSNLHEQDKQTISSEVPAKLPVPSGSMIKINYENPERPTLAVRLQEVFGMQETPKILNNKVPVIMELLSPNYRSVQITTDLTSFWQKAYQEVRKQLKIKYPKHSWPEDPTTAPAVAKGGVKR